MSLDPRKLKDSNQFNYTENQNLYHLGNDNNGYELNHDNKTNQEVGFYDNQGINNEEEDDDQASLYTLEDEFGKANINDSQIYNLPTHISSHHDILEDSIRTQPPSPVSTPFQEIPTHPLRALSQTNLLSNSKALQDVVDSSPLSRIIDLDEEQNGNNINDNNWDERGAAKFVQKNKNLHTGKEEEIVIKRSVKDFKFGKTLGFGSYSTVILATDKNTSKNFAVKVLDKRHIIKEKKVKYVNIEKNTLNRLGSRNGIIHLFFTFQDESSLYFVLDYASNGELLNLIKKYGSLNEETTKYYSAQILDAIKFMHDNGVIHRDLKPENILLNKDLKIQITDFGTAKLLEKDSVGNYPLDTRAKSFVGTAEYVSPELLNEKSIGKPCDIWAFGCIIFQMIAGKPPFKATNEYLTFQKIIKLQYAFTAGFPMVIRDLIKKILVLNPKDRINIKGIQNHLFFDSINFNNNNNNDNNQYDEVWSPSPPEIPGPYKINAKSMLPIPELINQPKSKITITRRIPSSSTTTSNTTPSSPSPIVSNVVVANDSTSSPLEESIEQQQNPKSKPKPKLQPTASQQVLMRAKEKVAARKAAQQGSNGIAGAAGAANAASIALSRQPNDIIKEYNVQKESRKRQTEDLSTPPLSASSNLVEKKKYASTSIPEKKNHNGGIRKKSNTPKIQPITDIDYEYSKFLKIEDNERILQVGEILLYSTNVELLEKKYKGKLIDISNKVSSNSLLSQIANGSYKGLRNMEKYGEEVEKTIISSHIDETTNGNDDDLFKDSGSQRFKFRKFFGSTSLHHEYVDDSSTSSDQRKKTLIITNFGRCLFFNSENELRIEIDLNHPVIRIKELIESTQHLESLTPSQSKTKSFFIIESYQRGFLIETSKNDITKWTRSIVLSKNMNSERIVNKEKSSTTSSTRAVLGNSRKSSSSSSASASRKTSSTTSSLAPAPKLYHGLPIKPVDASQSSSLSEEDYLLKAAKLAINKSPGGSPKTTSNSSFSPRLPENNEKRLVTGMNSRMLARSHMNQKKR
ncbi:hypothetical protein WICMUC_001292 [Wickerhamomyces mucosus]|uniref:non-specific serine/threonine protein kinase n=1 Tax=Wickerhamomyces mucosus TaxID=1378264 RepID=A0A9P8THK9_9ASCO|nr:hypothetical protein WICMUC_001292 [Wickerhamomyces mucosus]